MRIKPIPQIALILALLLTLPAAAGALPDAQPAEQQETARFVPGQVIVKFSENAGNSQKDNIKRFYGLKKKIGFSFGAELLTMDGTMPEESMVRLLNNLKHVEYAQLDYIIERPEPTLDQPPITDPRLSELWGMDNIDAPEAWTLDQGDERIIVAVIDTGVQILHPDLNDNIWTNPLEKGGDEDGNGYVGDVNGWDFYNNDGTVYDGIADYHGTHVAGTIAAEANGIGVVGVAPNCTILPLKFLGPNGGSSSKAALALQYAEDQGARIANASWGGGPYNPLLVDAIEHFDGVFVASAGNSSQNTDIYIHYPSSYEHSNLVSVASISPNNKKSGFSNYGVTSVDLFAPGAKILSTYPGGYAKLDGTSMAAPHISGALALMISHELHVNTPAPPDYVPRDKHQLIAHLFESTVKTKFYTSYVATGGRLNVMDALALTPNYDGTAPPEPPADPDVLAVESSVPNDGARNVSKDVLIKVDFNQDLSTPSESARNTITLDKGGSISSISIDPLHKDVLLIQTESLDRLTVYTLTIPAYELISFDGDDMPAAFTLSFKTKNK